MPPDDTVSSITINDTTDLHYGDTLDYSYTLEKLKGQDYGVVGLTCYQDVDEDGTVDTSPAGPDMVYAAPLAKPGDPVRAGGPTTTSLWTDRGGTAVCRLDLYAYGKQGNQQTIRHLDSSEEFEVQNP